MPLQDLDFVCRKPRFLQGPACLSRIEARQTTANGICLTKATLLNFSRDGAQFRTCEPLEDTSQMTLCLYDKEDRLSAQLPGQLRWRSRDEEGWLFGCQFDEQVSWEVLGELFLAGVLSEEAE